MSENNIEFDLYGVEHQRREEILKSKKYARIEIIIPREEVGEKPFSILEISKVTPKEVGEMIAITKEVISHLEKENPLARLFSMMCKLKGKTIIDVTEQEKRKREEE